MYNFDMEQETKKTEIKRESVYHENIKDNEYLPVFFDFVSAKKMFIPCQENKISYICMLIAH